MGLALAPLFLSCNGEPSRPARPATVLLGASYGSDPIRVPHRGELARAAFRRYVAKQLAGPWMRFLALDRAVQAELGAKGDVPRSLLSKVRHWVRADGLLRAWQPRANGEFRSGKAEIDLAWCLGRLWVLRRGHACMPQNAAELESLFLLEMERRGPVLTDRGAACGGLTVEVEEVYPALLALITPEERDRLLLAALSEAR